MRSIVLTILLMATCSMVQAQKGVGGFLQAHLTYAQPLGAFGSTNLDEPDAGFNLGGMGVNFQFGNKLYKSIGLSVRGDLVLNVVNTDEFVRQIAEVNTNYNWSMDIAVRRTVGFSFGPHYSQNLGRWAIEARVAAGALNFYSPTLNIKGSSKTSTDNSRLTILEKSTTSWSVTSDLTAKYEFKTNWVLSAQVAHFISRPKFNDVIQQQFVNEVLINEEQYSYSQSFQMIQFGLGCGYVF